MPAGRLRSAGLWYRAGLVLMLAAALSWPSPAQRSRPVRRGPKSPAAANGGMPLVNFSGVLQVLNEKLIRIQTGEEHPLDFRRNGRTRFFRQDAEIQPGAFKTGDHVSVEASRDIDLSLIAVHVYEEEGLPKAPGPRQPSPDFPSFSAPDVEPDGVAGPRSGRWPANAPVLPGAEQAERDADRKAAASEPGDAYAGEEKAGREKVPAPSSPRTPPGRDDSLLKSAPEKSAAGAKDTAKPAAKPAETQPGKNAAGGAAAKSNERAKPAAGADQDDAKPMGGYADPEPDGAPAPQSTHPPAKKPANDTKRIGDTSNRT